MDLYREEILEHWRNPQNFGVMDKPDVVVEQVNPLCGDELTLYVRLNAEKRGTKNAELRGRKVVDVSFVGSGCAISTASASMLSEAIKGKSIDTISRITGKDVLSLIGGNVAPARLKCAFLALEAVKKLERRI